MSEKLSGGYDGPAGLYKLEDIDLTDFFYKLHTVAGDYWNESVPNMNRLAFDGADDYCVLMNDDNIVLYPTELTYRENTDINDALRAFPHDARAYLFQIDEKKEGRQYGTALLVNCGELSEHIAASTISFLSVEATQRFGPDKHFSRSEWQTLEGIDKSFLESWKFRYGASDIANTADRQAAFWHRCKAEAEAVTPETLLGWLNAEYMRQADHPEPEMLRIPLGTAKSMLLHEDAPVYRLLPKGPEQLAPIAAAKGNGLWFERYREFAVKREDHAGLDKMCRREAGKLLGIAPERKAPDRKRDYDR